jgi:hypothetical protein
VADKPRRSLRPRLPGWRGLGIAAAILLLAGFAWFWWQGVPMLYEGVSGVSPADRLKAITDTRTAVLAGLAATGALGTLWLTARAQRFTAQALRVSEQTLGVSIQGHVTELYTKASDQLGSDQAAVRAFRHPQVRPTRARWVCRTAKRLLRQFLRSLLQPLYYPAR